MSKLRFLAVAAVCSTLLAVAGCASAPISPAGASNPAGGSAAVLPDDYLIGPGDSLDIFVWDHPELSSTVPVRVDGKVSSRLVDELPAAGKRPMQLAREIEQILARYVTSPVVSVIVLSSVGDVTQQIRVLGQAAQPQSLQYRQGMTVLDVLIAVGGLSEVAAGNRATLVRTVNGESTQTRVRLDDLMNGDVAENMAVRPGDVLVIPESFF